MKDLFKFVNHFNGFPKLFFHVFSSIGYHYIHEASPTGRQDMYHDFGTKARCSPRGTNACMVACKAYLLL